MMKGKTQERRTTYPPLLSREKMKEGKLMEVVDRSLVHTEHVTEGEVRILVHVAFWCIQENPELRPNMTNVVDIIEGRKAVDVPTECSMFVVNFFNMESQTSLSKYNDTFVLESFFLTTPLHKYDFYFLRVRYILEEPKRSQVAEVPRTTILVAESQGIEGEVTNLPQTMNLGERITYTLPALECQHTEIETDDTISSGVDSPQNETTLILREESEHPEARSEAFQTPSLVARDEELTNLSEEAVEKEEDLARDSPQNETSPTQEGKLEPRRIVEVLEMSSPVAEIEIKDEKPREEQPVAEVLEMSNPVAEIEIKDEKPKEGILVAEVLETSSLEAEVEIKNEKPREEIFNLFEALAPNGGAIHDHLTQKYRIILIERSEETLLQDLAEKSINNNIIRICGNHHGTSGVAEALEASSPIKEPEGETAARLASRLYVR